MFCFFFCFRDVGFFPGPPEKGGNVKSTDSSPPPPLDRLSVPLWSYIILDFVLFTDWMMETRHVDILYNYVICNL